MWAGVSRERWGAGGLGVEGEWTRSSGERDGTEARMECAAAENPEEQRPHGGRWVRPRTQGGPAQWTHAYRGAVGTAVWRRARGFGSGGGRVVPEDTSGLREG